MMNEDTTRLLDRDDLLPEARELLSSMQPTTPIPPTAQTQLAARIDQVAMQPATTTGLWAIGGPAVLGALVAIGVSFGLASERAPALSSAELPPPVRTETPRVAVAVRLVPAPRVEAPPVVLAAPTPSTDAPATANAKPTLAEELRLLAAAKAILPSDPEAALAKVELHAERYPAGQLADMREYLRLQVHAKRSGGGVEVEAARFLVRFPASPFRKDVLELRARHR